MCHKTSDMPEILLKVALNTITLTLFKHKFDSLNTYPIHFQYLMDASNLFDDMFRLSNLCLKQVHW